MDRLGISLATLTSKYFYNPETGFFHRRVNLRGIPFDPPTIGPRCFDRMSHDGFTYVEIFNCEIRGDYLAWFFTYGEWPERDIRHIDGNGDNNKIDNLCLVSPPKDYGYETREFTKPEKKPKGIRKTKSGKFQAFVFKWCCSFYLGLFDTEQEAIEACKIAKKAKDPDEIIYKRQRDRITPPEERLPKERKRKNKGGPRGIMKQHNGTYHARIKIDGTYISLGSYKREEEALSVYRRAKARAQYVKEEKRQKFLSDTEKLKKMLLEP